MGIYAAGIFAAGLIACCVIVRVTHPPPRLPLSILLLRLVAVVYLWLFKRFRAVNSANVPLSGALILVANHTSPVDPVCMQVACKHRLIRWMQAREYYEKQPFLSLYQFLRVIPVNRTGNDTASVRQALRELASGGCIGIFPEGKIVDEERIHEARKGVALLSLMSNATVVPAYIQRTHRFSGMIRDFLQFNRVVLHFGPPIRFDDLAPRHREQECRDLAMTRIVDAINDLQAQAVTSSPSPEAPR